MNERPIKVLHIIDNLGMGGAETWLMEVLRHWSKSGAHRMDFLLTSATRGIFDDEARQLGAQIHYVRYGRAHMMQFAHEFCRILQDGRYQVIHDHADYASGWHFLLGRKSLPPVRVTHVHNAWLYLQTNYAVSVPRRLTALIGRRLVHRLATHVCGTSGEILRQYGFKLG